MSEVFVKETGVGRLNVEKKFKELIAVATGPDSAYIRAKESVVEYYDSTQLTERDKATFLSKLIGDMSIALTESAMQAAIKIETEDRDAPYALAKVVADVKATQTGIKKVEKDAKLTDVQVKKINADILASKVGNALKSAEVRSKTGYDVDPLTAAISSSRDTKSVDYSRILTDNTQRYTTLAGSYRNHGKFTGYTDGIPTSMETSSTGYVGLIEAQRKVAVRTEKAFDDNAIQHAVNSSANTVGMLVSSQNADLMGTGKKGEAVLNNYVSALGMLIHTNDSGY